MMTNTAIDLYSDGTILVPIDFWDFACEMDFSVRLFHHLRRLGVANDQDVLDFYFKVFDLSTYEKKWGKRTAFEFADKIGKYLNQKELSGN
jgi:hypothetical protein